MARVKRAVNAQKTRRLEGNTVLKGGDAKKIKRLLGRSA